MEENMVNLDELETMMTQTKVSLSRFIYGIIKHKEKSKVPGTLFLFLMIIKASKRYILHWLIVWDVKTSLKLSVKTSRNILIKSRREKK
jgi:hypothetical protein